VNEFRSLGVSPVELEEHNLFAGFSHCSTAEDVFMNGLNIEAQHADPITVSGAIGKMFTIRIE